MRKYLPIIKLKYLLFSIFLSGILFPGYSNVFQSADSVLNIKKTLTAEDLIRGERLFFGLVYQDNKSINCAGCHNVRVSDTLNWNPDALEISRKYLDKSASDLSKVLFRPAGKKILPLIFLFQLHSGILECYLIWLQFVTKLLQKSEKLFMDSLALGGPVQAGIG